MEEQYQIKLPVFEGPFDLLLHLIRENQVDIYDIPIAQITDQYLQYLQTMRELDLDVASSFLVMAATLLSIKAKMLLPTPPNEEEEVEDAREELVHDLLEYLRFKDAAAEMTTLLAANHRQIARPNVQELYMELFSEENPLNGKTLSDLQGAFQKVLARAVEQDPVLSLERSQVTLQDRLQHLYRMLCEQQSGITFTAAFADCTQKIEMVLTFLALLELIRQHVVRIHQGSVYGEIYLYAGDLERYDGTVTF